MNGDEWVRGWMAYLAEGAIVVDLRARIIDAALCTVRGRDECDSHRLCRLLLNTALFHRHGTVWLFDQ